MKGAIIIGGHIQGLGIMRSLGKKNIPIYLVDTSRSIASYSKYCKKFFKFGAGNFEKELIDHLIEISNEAKDWIIFPTGDDHVRILSENRELLEKYFKIPTPAFDRLKFLHNKKYTYQLCKQLNVPIPLTFCPKDREDLEIIDHNISYPAILKPAMRHKFYEKTHSQLFVINNKIELFEFYDIASGIIKKDDIIIQEVIKTDIEDHLSVGVFFKDGNIICNCFIKKHRQAPMDHGTGTCYEIIPNQKELLDYCWRILSASNYYGICEFDFLKDKNDGIFKLIDINPRTFKWHYLATLGGVDLTLILYNDMYNLPGSVETESRIGLKLVDEYADLYVAASEILKRRMSIRKYRDSLNGQTNLAVASLKDPLPFIMETLTLPYIFWNRRVV